MTAMRLLRMELRRMAGDRILWALLALSLVLNGVLVAVDKQEQPETQPEPQTAETVQRQQPTDRNIAHQMSMEEAFFGGQQ